MNKEISTNLLVRVRKSLISWRGLYALIFIVYVVAWLGTQYTFSSLPDNGKFEHLAAIRLGVDASDYVSLANTLLNHGRFSLSESGLDETFRTPGYPMIMAATKAVTGSFFLVPLIQILLTFLAGYVLYRITLKYVGLGGARTASLLFLLQPLVVFHTIVIASDMSFVLFFLLSLSMILVRLPMRYAFLGGVVLGVATLIRPIGLYFIPVAVVAIAFVEYKHLDKYLIVRKIILFSLGSLIFITPWMIRNHSLTGSWSLSSLSSYNVVYYNIPEYHVFKQGGSVQDLRLQAFKESGVLLEDARDLNRSAELDAYSKKFLSSNFFPYTLFHLVKTVPFFVSSGTKNIYLTYRAPFGPEGVAPIPQSMNVTSVLMHGDVAGIWQIMKTRGIFLIEYLYWFIIAVLAIYGIFKIRDRRIGWTCVAIVVILAFMTGPVAHARYRIPAEPFLYILASAALVGLYHRRSKPMDNLLSPEHIKHLYDGEIKDRFGSEYEKNRWFKNSIQRANYDMTKRSIESNFITAIKTKDAAVQDYLEVGPGPGTWTKVMRVACPVARFQLVDISHEMLSMSKQAFAKDAGVSFLESDFLAFKPERTYDLFFSSRAIEYMPDKASAVAKIYSALKSGGSGFIITKTPKYWAYKLMGRKVSEMHRGQISPKLLKKLLTDGGFGEVSMYPAAMTFPFLKFAGLNRALYTAFGHFHLNWISEVFSESYCVRFKKQL